jgi:heptosyltransferase-3
MAAAGDGQGVRPGFGVGAEGMQPPPPIVYKRPSMRILFITSNRIGDAILSTGLLNHLVRTHPQAGITVVAGPAAAPLFAATPGVVRVIPWAKQSLARHWLKLWWFAVRRRWGLVVDLRGSALSHLLVAEQRRVLRSDGGAEHRVIHLARLLDLGDEPPPPRLHLSSGHRAAALELVPGDGAVLAIGPTANWGGKQWPAERFAAVAAALTRTGGVLAQARVAIFGAENERGMARPLIDSLPPERCIDLVGKVDLLTAAACLERCALYVGNDSGLMHLAAASGIPTLGLFGPSKETLYGPWGVRCLAVRTDLSYDQILAQPGYDYRKPDSHMLTLPVERVIDAAEALWRKRGARAA